MFFLLLFCLHLTLTARAYKYASSLSLEELVRTTPKALEPMPWPNDAFVIVVEPRNEQDMINMTPALIYVVYRGNDTTVPRLSEVTITPPESVHAVMKDLCTSAGFSGADFFACMGAEVRDAVSNTVYGQPYSPMKPTATIHDFKARRYNVISWLITRMLYTSYLEIGCDSGQSFQVIVQATEGILTDAVCVDPDEKTGATLHMTSDAFFASLQKASGPPATVTGGPDADAAGARSGSRGGGNGTTTFDVVFVDGLHEANQAYRDVMHAWHALRPGGTILMHDVNPPHEYMATYPMHQVEMLSPHDHATLTE
jgi:SAM-dependent methyltransferase